MITLYETLFVSKDDKDVKRNNHLKQLINNKDVQEFVGLSKKLIIDKKKLSEKEQKRLKELYKYSSVQTYIGVVSAKKARLFKNIAGFFISKYAVAIPLAFLTGSFAAALLAGSLAGLAGFVAVGAFTIKDDLKKVKEELKQLGIDPSKDVNLES